MHPPHNNLCREGMLRSAVPLYDNYNNDFFLYFFLSLTSIYHFFPEEEWFDCNVNIDNKLNTEN